MPRRSRVSVLAVLIGAVILATGCQSAPAAATPPNASPAANPPSAAGTAPAATTGARVHVRAAYTSDSGAELPFLVAQQTGLFEQQGLDVSVDRIAGGSSKVVQVIIAGELDVAQIGGPAVVDANVAGADIVYLATHIPRLAVSVFGAPSIARVEDLRGKSLAITRVGTITDFGARYALSRAQLVPETDVGLIQTGGNAETLAAMQSANVAGGMISAPVDVPARKLGFHEVLDLATTGLEFPYDGVAVQRTYRDGNEETLRRFLQAYVAGIARIHHDKPFAKQVLSGYTGTDDDEALESGYAVFGDRYLARAPYPTIAQFQSIVDFVADREPSVRELPLTTVIDDHFIRALDQAGFIDGLYK
jgi:NitT/TauT family transport system substrate-binding protein